MPAGDDFEPQIGEIRAVRTFRVGSGGVLYPLFSPRAWEDGANVAACNAAAHGSSEHVPPDPDCTCGFYAYADLAGAKEYPHTRHVLAVVSCWGRVIVATKGLRAQYARLDAIWLSASVPADLARSVGERYPGAAVYRDRDVMLAEHAPTVLSDYEKDRLTGSRGRQLRARLLAAAAITAGLLPSGWIGQLPYGWACWSALLIILGCVGLAPLHHRRDVVAQRRRMICGALALWMVAPLLGSAGLLLLRLPLIQIAVLIAAQKLALNRIARTFPAQIS